MTNPDRAPASPAAPEIVDTPRVGWILWLALGGFLIPPVLITLYSMWWDPFPHQQLWIVLLLAPIPLVVLSLPRHYRLTDSHLVVVGAFYRVRVPRGEIMSIRRLSPGKALLHPGSVFCSDPSRALLVSRKDKRSLVISPKDTASFLAIAARTNPVP